MQRNRIAAVCMVFSLTAGCSDTDPEISGAASSWLASGKIIRIIKQPEKVPVAPTTKPETGVASSAQVKLAERGTKPTVELPSAKQTEKQAQSQPEKSVVQVLAKPQPTQKTPAVKKQPVVAAITNSAPSKKPLALKKKPDGSVGRTQALPATTATKAVSELEQREQERLRKKLANTEITVTPTDDAADLARELQRDGDYEVFGDAIRYDRPDAWREHALTGILSSSHEADEWNIREAVFRYQFQDRAIEALGDMSYYFLFVGPLGDPPAQFIDRFQGISPRVEPASFAGASTEVGVVHKYDRRQGVIFKTSGIRWLDDNTVDVSGSFYQTPESTSGKDYRVERRSGRWQVAYSTGRWSSIGAM